MSVGLPVQESINLISGFDAIRFIYFFFSVRHIRCRRFLPALPALFSQTLNCSKTSVERSFERCQSVCRRFPGVSLPGACGPLWSSFHSAPLSVPLDSAILLPAADCLSWRGHLPLNSLRSDIMTSSKKLARSLLRGGENACLLSTTGPNRTANMHYDKLPGKKKKQPLSVIVSFSVCVIVSRNHSPA